MKPVILYRKPDQPDAAEEAAMQRHFGVITQRTQVNRGDLVIGRYSVLPFYKELEQDLNNQGASLINTSRQHRYIADLANWAADLSGLTPKTWTRLQDVPEYGGPYVVKGQTNSRKDKWLTHMFAQTKRDAVEVAAKLRDDNLFATQEIYVREYVPLKTLMYGINGQPITVEQRYFVYKGKVLSQGYYWSSHIQDLRDAGLGVPHDSPPEKFVREVIERIGDNADFYVIDFALTEKGEWIVIELNDGQMSGLSENDPEVLYRNLKEALNDGA